MDVLMVDMMVELKVASRVGKLVAMMADGKGPRRVVNLDV